MKKRRIDPVTKAWSRNKGDAIAVRNRCWFDELAGAYVVWWIERYCRLYEGEWAGEPMRLRGCAQCKHDWPIPEDFDEKESLKRAASYRKCVAKGHQCDWQYEVTMRLFGWRRNSERWGRDVRRFREASIWVPKKNKKSPTLAAWSLYLFCGDGEPGQKVFLGAKDGSQAKEIAGKHTIEMVSNSPELSDECDINRGTTQIAHRATRSVLRTLSSSNSRTQEAKEGINGSVLIDETHVVDRPFVKRVKRAGISRSEPLHIEVSTAGNNPDGYGKERRDYAREVANGTKPKDSLLFVEYAAPDGMTDEQLAKNPVKYGKMANPAWGHTVNEEEYLEDYHGSKHSITELADFKMYRLNVWQHSANPWLKSEDWSKCQKPFVDRDLYGRECWAALDLAAVKDLCSLCLCFPESDEAYKFLWWFWLPRETARKTKDDVPWLDWEQDPLCNLTLTEGETVHYGAIRSHFRKLHTLYNIRELAYDDWNAEQTTQEIEQGITDLEGQLIEPGTGVPRVNFSQSLRSINEPTKHFERLVIEGKAHHNGAPIMVWQAGHCKVFEDHNGNIRPVKPKRGSVQKIDGMVTAVMACDRARKRDDVQFHAWETQEVTAINESDYEDEWGV